jgi:hypothetical protein
MTRPVPHTPDPFPNFNREPSLTDAELAKVEAVAKRSFTPGPWSLSRWPKQESAIVARVAGKPSLVTGYALHADAALIAAAPDLYEALADVMREFFPHATPEEYAELAAARAALAKATGA